jgi:hypothetical protein
MKAVEIGMYKYMLQNFPHHAQYVERVLLGKNRLSFRNGVRADIPARRMSGDMCTSLGNGFTNLMLMLFCAKKLGFTATGFVEGDDGIFRVDRVDAAVSDLLLKLGFRIKLEQVEDPALGGFCGIVAADCGNIKDPIRFLQTFGWTSSCVEGGQDVMWQLLRAKALSARYELPNCPILRVLADRALELTSGVTARFEQDGYHRPPPSDTVHEFAPTVATRELFARLYGVSPSQQVECETRLRGADDANFLAEYLTFDAMYYWYDARFVGP